MTMLDNFPKSSMRIFWLFFILLLILHQDFWNWSSEKVIFLGMPIGLFYHAIFSIACSALGGWAVLCAWPVRWEKYSEIKEGSQAKYKSAKDNSVK